MEIFRTVLEGVLDLVRRSTRTQQQLSVYLILLLLLLLLLLLP